MLLSVKPGELKDTLQCVETALGIFQRVEGGLTVGEIRTRSLLMVVQAELQDHIRRVDLLAPPTPPQN